MSGTPSAPMLAAASWLLLVTLGAVPQPVEPQLSVETAQVESDAVADALELRTGPSLKGWSIRVGETDVRGDLEVELRCPDGARLRRHVVLTGATPVERSRELAAALALIIDEYQPRAHAEHRRQPKPRAPVVPRPRGWLGLGPRVGLGPPDALDPDFGAGLTGGLWLAHDHVQPVVDGGWSTSADGDLRLDGIRFGAGVLGGARAADGRLWVGAGVLGRALWVRAQDRTVDQRWVSTTAVAWALQFRGRRGLFVGLRSGIDLTLPPVRATGHQSALRWGMVRFFAALSLGIHL